MRILTIASSVPFPPIDGGKIRTFHLLRSLAERHDVTLLGFAFGERSDPPPFPLDLRPIPWREPEIYREMRSEDPRVSEAALRELEDETGEPWYASFYRSPEMERALEMVGAAEFDVALIEGTDMARFLPWLPPSVPRVLDFMDLCTRMLARSTDPRERLEARRMLRFERSAARDCDRCLAVSADEARAAMDLLGLERVETIPNGVDVEWFAPSPSQPRPETMLFTGSMNYRPNVEAVQHFTSEILPRIRERCPAAVLHIVGHSPVPEVLSLSSDAVKVHGGVPDVRPHFRAAEVVVVPVKSGGGTRLKVLEAAASGKAIVSTPQGIEGIDFAPGFEYLPADDPRDFADRVVDIFEKPELRRDLEVRARRAALAHDWNTIGMELDRLLTEVVAPV
jgi:sugar transferase (PEP-CTERM/EpsH1 system associated)